MSETKIDKLILNYYCKEGSDKLIKASKVLEDLIKKIK